MPVSSIHAYRSVVIQTVHEVNKVVTQREKIENALTKKTTHFVQVWTALIGKYTKLISVLEFAKVLILLNLKGMVGLLLVHVHAISKVLFAQTVAIHRILSFGKKLVTPSAM